MSSPQKPWYRSKWFNLSLGTGVTVASLWWALQTMRQGAGGPDDLKSYEQVFREIAGAFRTADYRSLPVMWFSLALFYIVKAWRWQMLLVPLGRFRTMKELLPSVMIGFAFNNVLPAHLGEFVRTFVFSREQKLPATGVLSSIALERIFDIIAILTFLAGGMLLVDSSKLDSSVVVSAWVFAGIVCVALAGAAVYLTWTTWFVATVERILRSLPLIPESLAAKIAGMLEAGAHGLSSLRSVRLLIGILLTSWFQWALNGFIIYLSLWAFGIEVSPLVSAIVLGVVAVGVTVPSTPGYFGVVQLCFLLVLKLFVEPEQTESVFAASIYYHMAQWLPVTAIGMLYFLRAGVRLSDVQEEAGSDNDSSSEREESSSV